VLIEAGVLRPMRPDKLLRIAIALARWGRSPAAGAVTLAERHPDDPMIVDELGIIVAPVILGGGKHLFQDFTKSLDLENLSVRQSRWATFMDFAVKR